VSQTFRTALHGLFALVSPVCRSTVDPRPGSINRVLATMNEERKWQLTRLGRAGMLYDAAAVGDVATIRRLVAKGADVNVRGGDGGRDRYNWRQPTGRWMRYEYGGAGS
jgi:hypothetical protein